MKKLITKFILCLSLLATNSSLFALETPSLASRIKGWMGKKSIFLSPVRDKIAVMEVVGPIMETSETTRWLRHFEKEVPGLKAVVIAIDSPGGGVAASQEIYSAIRRLQESGKKVVVSMGSVAASGGYYIACPADKIVANPGTITGSIGVIMETATASKLIDKIGLRFEVVKSGRFKDIGNFARVMKPEERAMLQGVIDDVYDQFITAIAEGRKEALVQAMQEGGEEPGQKVVLEKVKAYLRTFADGRIFSGRQALKLGLVDELGDLQDAIDLAAEISNISGKPEILTPRRRLSLAELLSGLLHLDLHSLLQTLNPQSGFKIAYEAW